MLKTKAFMQRFPIKHNFPLLSSIILVTVQFYNNEMILGFLTDRGYVKCIPTHPGSMTKNAPCPELQFSFLKNKNKTLLVIAKY